MKENQRKTRAEKRLDRLSKKQQKSPSLLFLNQEEHQRVQVSESYEEQLNNLRIRSEDSKNNIILKTCNDIDGYGETARSIEYLVAAINFSDVDCNTECTDSATHSPR